MARFSRVAAGSCAMLLACGAPRMSVQQRAVEQGLVQDRLETWVRALNNRFLDTLASIYAQVPELTVAWHDGRRTRGWEQQQPAQRAFFTDVAYMNFVVQDPTTMLLSDQFALSTFRVSIDIRPANQQRLPVAAGQGTILWMKDPADKLWKIYAEHVSQNPAPVQQPAAISRRR